MVLRRSDHRRNPASEAASVTTSEPQQPKDAYEQAVDRALEALGQTPLRANPAFLLTERPWTQFVFNKPGSPTIWFDFGDEMEIGIDPFDEVFVFVKPDVAKVCNTVHRLLTSKISVYRPRWKQTLTLTDDDGTWKRVTHSPPSRKLAIGFTANYDPAFPRKTGPAS